MASIRNELRKCFGGEGNRINRVLKSASEFNAIMDPDDTTVSTIGQTLKATRDATEATESESSTSPASWGTGDSND